MPTRSPNAMSMKSDRDRPRMPRFDGQFMDCHTVEELPEGPEEIRHRSEKRPSPFTVSVVSIHPLLRLQSQSALRSFDWSPLKIKPARILHHPSSQLQWLQFPSPAEEGGAGRGVIDSISVQQHLLGRTDDRLLSASPLETRWADRSRWSARSQMWRSLTSATSSSASRPFLTSIKSMPAARIEEGIDRLRTILMISRR